MLHSKRGVTNKKAGFSLIELLVVVAIIGILAAVAIPAYNQYRKDAAIGAFTASGTNFARAFRACITTRPFGQCDTFAKVGVTGDVFKTVVAKAPILCGNLEEDIVGETYKGCFSVNGATGNISSSFGFNSCYKDGGPKTLTDPAVTCTTGQDSDVRCEEAIIPLAPCSGSPECVSGGTGVYCISGNDGECKVADATCN